MSFKYSVSTALVLSLLSPLQLMSQILPKEGSKLHYRLIGFSFPVPKHSDRYRLEISAGYYNNADSFEKNIINQIHSDSARLIAEVPFFGAQYTWRIVGLRSDPAKTSYGGLHHFSTQSVPEVDSTNARLRVIKPGGDYYKNALVFLDDNKALYDMNGHPVWYLPDIGLKKDNAGVRDLKLTPQGTITFLVNDKEAYEIDYNGNILWKGPNNNSEDKDIHYHHEFTRLSNGHYMVLGTESVLLKRRAAGPRDSASAIVDEKEKKDSNSAYFTFPFSVLFEYDEAGTVVWSWKTSHYFSGILPPYYKPERVRNQFEVHANSFFFDEKNKNVYVSFRNISWLVKVAYPSGDVENVYGEVYKPGVKQQGNDLFRGQHSVKVSSDGDLYLFDNNVSSIDNLPKVEIFREPGGENGRLKKIWEYQCTIDDDHEQLKKTMGFTSGGNVRELPDGAMFITMSSPYGKISIVNRKKEILWSVLPEKWSPPEKKWNVAPQYRASIICDTADINKMIWHGTQE
jgi:arylsulfotransferase ASST